MALPVMVLLIGIKDIRLFAYSWFRTLKCDSSSAFLKKERETKSKMTTDDQSWRCSWFIMADWLFSLHRKPFLYSLMFLLSVYEKSCFKRRKLPAGCSSHYEPATGQPPCLGKLYGERNAVSLRHHQQCHSAEQTEQPYANDEATPAENPRVERHETVAKRH